MNRAQRREVFAKQLEAGSHRAEKIVEGAKSLTVLKNVRAAGIREGFWFGLVMGFVVSMAAYAMWAHLAQ